MYLSSLSEAPKASSSCSSSIVRDSLSHDANAVSREPVTSTFSLSTAPIAVLNRSVISPRPVLAGPEPMPANYRVKSQLKLSEIWMKLKVLNPMLE